MCAASLAVGAPSTAWAAGVVGTGTAASCTDAALDAALAGGGLVTFDCGPDPVTIDISTGTGTKMIAADTTVDGGGLITLSGGTSAQIFVVPPELHLTLSNVTLANGKAVGLGGTEGGEGGAIFNAGMLTLTNSTVMSNSTSGGGAGGGIFNAGSLSVTNSTFDGNSAGGGGGIHNEGSLTVTSSTFAGNSGDDGGGIINFGGLTVTNSTFNGNTSEFGGGIFLSGSQSQFTYSSSDIVSLGGGRTLSVTNSTFTGNSGGAIAANSASAPVLLRNTILANNSSPDGNCRLSPGYWLITDGGHNLDDGTSCGFSAGNGSLSNTDPQLDPAGLQDNGGPTQTVALCTGVGVPVGCTAVSPAIDAGDETVCAAAPVNNRDQSGFVRPGAGHTQCSIGAFEADASPPVCSGDCEGSGRVTVAELITGVNIALGSATLDQCRAFDCNGNGHVTVDCLVQAVGNALNGCTASVRFQPGSCDFKLPDGQDPNASCGHLTVPEDRGRAHGRTIRLAVAVLRATGEHRVSDPVVMLSGGPGDPALEGMMPKWTADVAAPLQAKRDLVFFDQRGTGRSQPALQCPEYTASVSAELAQPLTAEQDAAKLKSALRACHDRLVSEGVDLSAYTDAATAIDLHDLMKALGYSQWNLRGISNGTRVALTALRDEPDGIRSVVLDSTVPVQANWRADYSKDFERSLNTVFAACATDPGCNAAFPNFEQTFFTLVENLNASPITVQPTDPTTGEPFTVVITGDRLLLGVQQALYDTTLIPLLPLVITAAAGGDTALLTVAAARIAAPSANAQGVFRSDLCFEEIPFSTPDVVAMATDGVRAEIKEAGVIGINNLDDEVCAFWGARQPPALENEPVTSEVPALVLAGEYDPITPPAYGQLAAQTLANSFYFLFPGQGHGQLFNPLAPTCAIDLVAAFLDDPTQRPDGSCVDALPAPHFAGS